MTDIAFRPIRGNITESLIGVEATRQTFRGRTMAKDGNQHFIVQIIASALIFIVIIAIYELIRAFISTDFANQALYDEKSKNDDLEIRRTIVANRAKIQTNIVFTVISICILIPVICTIYV